MADFLPEFVDATLFFFVLFNPFLMSVYLLDLVKTLDGRTFIKVMGRASVIAWSVFALFAIGGDTIFIDYLQVRFASFMLFGGVIFLLIGIRYVMKGPEAIEALRGPPEYLAGAVAMPFMIGPGTVSASVLTGVILPIPLALLSVAVAMLGGVGGLILLKLLHDHVSKKNEELVERYIDLIGRAMSLLVGTIAIDMILTGIETWWANAGPAVTGAVTGAGP